MHEFLAKLQQQLESAPDSEWTSRGGANWKLPKRAASLELPPVPLSLGEGFSESVVFAPPGFSFAPNILRQEKTRRRTYQQNNECSRMKKKLQMQSAILVRANNNNAALAAAAAAAASSASHQHHNLHSVVIAASVAALGAEAPSPAQQPPSSSLERRESAIVVDVNSPRLSVAASHHSFGGAAGGHPRSVSSAGSGIGSFHLPNQQKDGSFIAPHPPASHHHQHEAHLHVTARSMSVASVAAPSPNLAARLGQSVPVSDEDKEGKLTSRNSGGSFQHAAFHQLQQEDMVHSSYSGRMTSSQASQGVSFNLPSKPEPPNVEKTLSQQRQRRIVEKFKLATPSRFNPTAALEEIGLAPRQNGLGAVGRLSRVKEPVVSDNDQPTFLSGEPGSDNKWYQEMRSVVHYLEGLRRENAPKKVVHVFDETHLISKTPRAHKFSPRKGGGRHL